MHYAKHTITMNMGTEDAQRGIQAFIEKKKPVWKDR
jgi:1,4-dihydroxy-2-naphthoyl-CoA synthase